MFGVDLFLCSVNATQELLTCHPRISWCIWWNWISLKKKRKIIHRGMEWLMNLHKPGGDNGSTCGKKGYFTANSLPHSLHVHLFSVVSRHGIGRPRCGEWGIPIDSWESIDYPVLQCLTHCQSGVHQFGYARLEQIRVLPAREVTILSAIASH
jgi:hypothetical protein